MKNPIPDAVLAQHTAILGKTGAGKTSTEKLAVEQVVAEGFRVCVLDTVKSDWWGVTSSANGKRPGLPFKILGGPHGHVPLHSSAGKVIGQLVGAGKLPLSIIDMADFEAGGIQRFFVDFAPALLRNMRGVVYLVIEEAHELAPKERAGIGAENLAIHWAKKLATAGRSKGIRLIVATQRVQSLHNAVLGSCETVIAHRLTTPADQEPVLKWLKANADKETVETVADSLSSLPTGTGWICSGEAQIFEKIKFPKFKTYDNTATPTGDTEAETITTAPVDQSELRELIGDAVKEAEANDPRKLHQEVAKLTRELAAAKSMPVPDPVTAQEAERRGFNSGYTRGKSDGYASALTDIRSQVNPTIDAIDAAVNAIQGAVQSVNRFTAWSETAAKNPPKVSAVPSSAPQTMLPKTPTAKDIDRIVENMAVPSIVPPIVRKILDEIHRANPMALSFEAASLRAGVSRRSSAYNAYRKLVEISPEVERRSDGRFISAVGYARPVEPGINPIDAFAARLPPSYARMLRVIAASVHPLTKNQIAELAGISPTSSGLPAGLAELIALNLIEKENETYLIHRDLAA